MRKNIQDTIAKLETARQEWVIKQNRYKLHRSFFNKYHAIGQLSLQIVNQQRQINGLRSEAKNGDEITRAESLKREYEEKKREIAYSDNEQKIFDSKKESKSILSRNPVSWKNEREEIQREISSLDIKIKDLTSLIEPSQGPGIDNIDRCVKNASKMKSFWLQLQEEQGESIENVMNDIGLSNVEVVNEIVAQNKNQVVNENSLEAAINIIEKVEELPNLVVRGECSMDTAIGMLTNIEEMQSELTTGRGETKGGRDAITELTTLIAVKPMLSVLDFISSQNIQFYNEVIAVGELAENASLPGDWENVAQKAKEIRLQNEPQKSNSYKKSVRSAEQYEDKKPYQIQKKFATVRSGNTREFQKDLRQLAAGNTMVSYKQVLEKCKQYRSVMRELDIQQLESVNFVAETGGQQRSFENKVSESKKPLEKKLSESKNRSAVKWSTSTTPMVKRLSAEKIRHPEQLSGTTRTREEEGASKPNKRPRFAKVGEVKRGVPKIGGKANPQENENHPEDDNDDDTSSFRTRSGG